MRKLCSFAPRAMLVACPFFAEVYPDPTELPDAQGEFVEILETQDSQDTLFLAIDSTPLASPRVISPGRLVLCPMDSLRIFPEYPVPCTPLRTTLPNSRPLQLTLAQGICRDTAWLEAASPGKSWLRSNLGTDSSRWVLASPSPGFALPNMEPNVRNESIHLDSARWDGEHWRVWITDSGSGAQQILVRWESMDEKLAILQDSSRNPFPTEWQSPLGFGPWQWISLTLQGDDYPMDNQVKALLSPPGEPLLQITEIAAEPPANIPEWFEIKNTSPYPLHTSDISNCSVMSNMDSTEMLAPGDIALITDSRAELLQAIPALGRTVTLESTHALSLRNSSDTVHLCWRNFAVDSLFWNSAKPLGNSQKYSPGWVTASSSQMQTPMLEARVLSISHKAMPLRLRIPPSKESWDLHIFDRHGKERVQQRNLPEGLWEWQVPSSFPKGPLTIVLKGANGNLRWEAVLVP